MSDPELAREQDGATSWSLVMEPGNHYEIIFDQGTTVKTRKLPLKSLPEQSTSHAFGVPPEIRKMILKEAFRPVEAPVTLSDRRPKIYKPSLPVGSLRLNRYLKTEAEQIMQEMIESVWIFTNMPPEEFEEAFGPLKNGIRRAVCNRDNAHKAPLPLLEIAVSSSRYPEVVEIEDVQNFWIMPMVNLPALCRAVQHIALEEPVSWPIYLMFREQLWGKERHQPLSEPMQRQIFHSFEPAIRTGVPLIKLQGDFSYDIMKTCTDQIHKNLHHTVPDLSDSMEDTLQEAVRHHREGRLTAAVDLCNVALMEYRLATEMPSLVPADIDGWQYRSQPEIDLLARTYFEVCYHLGEYMVESFYRTLRATKADDEASRSSLIRGCTACMWVTDRAISARYFSEHVYISDVWWQRMVCVWIGLMDNRAMLRRGREAVAQIAMWSCLAPEQEIFYDTIREDFGMGCCATAAELRRERLVSSSIVRPILIEDEIDFGAFAASRPKTAAQLARFTWTKRSDPRILTLPLRPNPLFEMMKETLFADQAERDREDGIERFFGDED